ncbi:hypothetical protein [Loigolactobacillus bifermentans]|jgi:hypothetical protein|uniref:Uncharacterized protein n=1 Tax=Loigolactobacillus bifermentans DSM 20003 TaxID=1423726 RepID=A0A0R1H3P4_9LACO|nr:hypothetical protein [Loigolactobacillus bifermentans]KRK40824.1 hypothetical protein FC07_GL002574 [Loigolactobacillus bifermentans DSM 20003]QGG59579.1 hypothetical protein LB003_03270 [Loigolactobacillus bifermentans]
MTTEEKNTVLQTTLLFLLMPVMVVISSLTLAYGWNTYLPTIWSAAPSMNWAQAFGITITLRMLLPNGYYEEEPDMTTRFFNMIGKPLVLLLALWLGHFWL